MATQTFRHTTTYNEIFEKKLSTNNFGIKTKKKKQKIFLNSKFY